MNNQQKIPVNKKRVGRPCSFIHEVSETFHPLFIVSTISSYSNTHVQKHLMQSPYNINDAHCYYYHLLALANIFPIVSMEHICMLITYVKLFQIIILLKSSDSEQNLMPLYTQFILDMQHVRKTRNAMLEQNMSKMVMLS